MSLGLPPKILIDMLLDFAPKAILTEMHLSKQTSKEWVNELEPKHATPRDNFNRVSLSALALHYMTKKQRTQKQLAPYLKLPLDPYTLKKLTDSIKVEEFSNADDLLTSILIEKGAQRMAIARQGRRSKYDWEKIAKTRDKYLSEGKSDRDITNLIHRQFGVPESTYRDWRRKIKTTAQ